MIKAIKIGMIDNGVDGCNVFYKVVDTENNLTVTQAEDYMYTKYGHSLEPSRIGDKFVSSILGTKIRDYIHDEVIIEVSWRYDV